MFPLHEAVWIRTPLLYAAGTHFSLQHLAAVNHVVLQCGFKPCRSLFQRKVKKSINLKLNILSCKFQGGSRLGSNNPYG
jgi:hypothetical protein